MASGQLNDYGFSQHSQLTRGSYYGASSSHQHQPHHQSQSQTAAYYAQQHLYDPSRYPFPQQWGQSTPLPQPTLNQSNAQQAWAQQPSQAPMQTQQSPEVTEAERSLEAPDLLNLRQQILDNAIVLLKATCPESYTGDNAVSYKLVLLQMGHPDRWRAAVAADSELAIEGPQSSTPLRALDECHDAIANKLAKVVRRAWDMKEDEGDQGVKIGVEEDGTGARFAVEKE